MDQGERTEKPLDDALIYRFNLVVDAVGCQPAHQGGGLRSAAAGDCGPGLCSPHVPLYSTKTCEGACGLLGPEQRKTV